MTIRTLIMVRNETSVPIELYLVEGSNSRLTDAIVPASSISLPLGFMGLIGIRPLGEFQGLYAATTQKTLLSLTDALAVIKDEERLARFQVETVFFCEAKSLKIPFRNFQ